jgi:hypothetical protein
MKKIGTQQLFAALMVGVAFLVGIPSAAKADQGNAPVTMSFFSGGQGGHADWLATSDQPPDDTDNQAIRLQTTNGAPTYEHGYAGILFHHVTGIPAADFPDSSFWNKTPCPWFGQPSTLGTPRLVVAFQTAAGVYDGYADLRQIGRGCDWEEVSDQTDPANSGWDVMNVPMTNTCYPFRYNLQWPAVQTCFAPDTTLAVYLTTDAYGIYHLIDGITVNGKTFSSASDNGNGNNTSAGPTATTDPSLLPPLFLLGLPIN